MRTNEQSKNEENAAKCKSPTTIPDDLRHLAALVLIIAIPNIIMWIYLYPGYFQADHQTSIALLAIGQPNEWHSFLWTIFSYPFLYLSPSFGIYGAVQIILFTWASVFSLQKLFILGLINKKGRILLAFFFGLFPTFLLYNELYSSDIVFAFILMPITTLLIELVMSKGKALENKKYLITLFVLLYLAIELRKNALLIPLLLFVFALVKFKPFRKKIIKVFAILLIALVATNSFNRYILNVAPSPSQELLSVPSNQIARTFIDDGHIPDSAKDYLVSLRSEDSWKNNYVSFSADPEKAGLSLTPGFIWSWFVTGIENPKSYLNAYIDLMNPFWELTYPDTQNISINLDFGESYSEFTLAYSSDLRNDYVRQFSKDITPAQEGVVKFLTSLSTKHIPLVTDFVNLVLLNRALPFWVLLIGAIYSSFKRKGKDFFFISIPLISLLISFLLFSPVALMRYTIEAYYLLPILFVWLMRAPTTHKTKTSLASSCQTKKGLVQKEVDEDFQQHPSQKIAEEELKRSFTTAQPQATT